jgi:anti-sigma regulatory factor (Ser/Thr protein kinase)
MADQLIAKMDPTPEAPAVAREALRRLTPTVGQELAGDVRLLVSELVTNSVKYGAGGPIELEVQAKPGWVRAEVIDHGNGFTPVARDRPMDEAGGWGLHLVEQVADRWGVYEGSTHVWFEIAREVE